MPIPDTDKQIFRQSCGYEKDDSDYDTLLDTYYDACEEILGGLGINPQPATNKAILMNMVAHSALISGAAVPNEYSNGEARIKLQLIGKGQGWLATTAGSTANALTEGLLVGKARKIYAVGADDPSSIDDRYGNIIGGTLPNLDGR